ncbi:MAG: CDP-alcohol phosphatidyltransferase family protein [Rhodospirillaceae bacterium]|nr:CDP-alcohol phosphatidyltransferase family protein [Rhodospirillaceae bacterium]
MSGRPAMVGDSWTHKIARICILPLVNTPVTPNHLTTVRLISGIGACVCFGVGEREFDVWGGWLWLFSAFLDRADGELARVSGKTSPGGHKYDMFCDIAVTSLFFLGAGIGLRHGWLGDWAVLAGVAGAAGVFVAEILAEKIDQMNQDTGEKAYPGFAGFDFDDVLYLFAPVVWLGWQMPFVVGASVGAPAFALLTWYRLVQQLARRKGQTS